MTSVSKLHSTHHTLNLGIIWRPFRINFLKRPDVQSPLILAHKIIILQYSGHTILPTTIDERRLVISLVGKPTV